MKVLKNIWRSLVKLAKKIYLKQIMIFLIIASIGFAAAELIYGLIDLWSAVLRLGFIVFFSVLVVKIKG